LFDSYSHRTDDAARRRRERVLSLLKFRRGMATHTNSRFREKGVQKNPHSFYLCLSLWREEEEEEEETSAPFFQNQLLSLSLSLSLSFPLLFSETTTTTRARATEKGRRET